MKFSENWLRSLVPIEADRATLCHRLTMAGLEVEGVEALGDGLAGVLIGEIVAAERHPAADKLQVCSVAIGAAEPLQIVCGAPNARVGLKAPLATIGTTLPNGMQIQRAALRGVESAGMLCSARELGLDGDAGGLLELPADAPVGAALASFLGLPDASIEIKLTPNRPDCLGMRGLAAEVSTLFGVVPASIDTTPVVVQSDGRRSITLDAPLDCPRYLGRVIEGIDPAADTPLWMAERLRRAGVRPISAVVDCTNYVMLELGQPMHAFDVDRIHGGIVVRRARDGEALQLLDERAVTLDPGFLVIADAQQALAVAGVMGGYYSRVTDVTRNVLLESAHFAPHAIVGRARKLGLHTDASHRFERGVDPALPQLALERLSALLLSIVGGRPGPVVATEHAAAIPAVPTVRLRAARLQRVLGMSIGGERVAEILGGLGMQVHTTADGWSVRPPSARFDIAIEEDLIEEVVRVHGYELVPTHVPAAVLQVESVTETRVEEAALRRALIERGYSECINFAFVANDLLLSWGVADGAVALANPLSAELGSMRTALLPGLVEAARRNLARQHTRVRLFEIGRVFEATSSGPRERLRLAGLAIGRATAEHWDADKRLVDFFDIKGDVEQLLALSAARDLAVAPATRAWLHPGRGAAVSRSGIGIGQVGMLHPRLLASLDLGVDVAGFEFDLVGLGARAVPRAGEVSRFPALRRDLAVVVPDTVRYPDFEAAIRAAAGKILRDLVLFDEYRGHGLRPDTRSLAIGLILQDDSRTLTDRDGDQAVAAVVAALARDFGAELRS